MYFCKIDRNFTSINAIAIIVISLSNTETVLYKKLEFGPTPIPNLLDWTWSISVKFKYDILLGQKGKKKKKLEVV